MSRKKGATAGDSKKAKADKVDSVDETREMQPKPMPRVSTVISPVPVALLERHPALPERQEVLEAFAHDYPHVLARAVELAQKLVEPEQKPSKKPRIEPPTLTGLRPGREDKARPTQMALPELDLSHEPAPVEPVVAPEPEPEPAFEPPPVVAAEDPFATDSADADDADAFFASLRGERMKTEEDLVFGAFTEAAPSAPPEGATVMMAAMPDDEPVSASDERTTMIQAIDDVPPEDTPLAEQGEGAAEGSSDTSTDAKTRKSRKATKRKRG